MRLQVADEWWQCALLAIFFIVVPNTAMGAAFAIIENSARGQSMAFAGGGAIAEDASAAWFNPAGIVRLENQLQVSSHIINSSFDFSDAGSQQLTPLGNLPLIPSADRSADGGQVGLVPNLYFVNAFSKRVFLGVAVNAPFGLATEYESDWVGRYQALKSDIKTININPNIAWNVNSRWSVALGVSVNYINVELTNALDFAAICGVASNGLCSNGALPGQGAFDGFVRNEGEDVSLGANFGVLWAGDTTRLSFTWRSQINHTLKGDADFSTPSERGGLAALDAPLRDALAATFADTDIEADVSLPDSASFSVYQQLSPRWGVSAAFILTDWEDIQDITIRFDNPLTPDGVEELGFKSAWRAALGVRLQLNDRWTLRSGTAFDESPTPNAALRSARLPDSDRYWVSAGFSYTLGRHYSIDFGYTHIFASNAHIDRVGSTQDRLVGDYDSAAEIVSLQLNATF